MNAFICLNDFDNASSYIDFFYLLWMWLACSRFGMWWRTRVRRVRDCWRQTEDGDAEMVRCGWTKNRLQPPHSSTHTHTHRNAAFNSRTQVRRNAMNTTTITGMSRRRRRWARLIWKVIQMLIRLPIMTFGIFRVLIYSCVDSACQCLVRSEPMAFEMKRKLFEAYNNVLPSHWLIVGNWAFDECSKCECEPCILIIVDGVRSSRTASFHAHLKWWKEAYTEEKTPECMLSDA